MIKDNTNGRLYELTIHAQKYGLAENFQEAIKQLIKFSENGCDVTYINDSTPHSIKFTITKDGKQTHSGGFIFTDSNDASENKEEPSLLFISYKTINTNMIIDNSNGRLDEINTYAKENNLLEIFNETYSRLENYFAKGYQVTLYSDFAPLSMEFSITNEGKIVLYGSFIFHGPHDGYGGRAAPTFSVSLSSDRKAGWSIHT